MLNRGEKLLKKCFWDITLNFGFLFLYIYYKNVVKVAFLGEKKMLLFIVKTDFCRDSAKGTSQFNNFLYELLLCIVPCYLNYVNTF